MLSSLRCPISWSMRAMKPTVTRIDCKYLFWLYHSLRNLVLRGNYQFGPQVIYHQTTYEIRAIFPQTPKSLAAFWTPKWACRCRRILKWCLAIITSWNVPIVTLFYIEKRGDSRLDKLRKQDILINWVSLKLKKIIPPSLRPAEGCIVSCVFDTTTHSPGLPMPILHHTPIKRVYIVTFSWSAASFWACGAGLHSYFKLRCMVD